MGMENNERVAWKEKEGLIYKYMGVDSFHGSAFSILGSGLE